MAASRGRLPLFLRTRVARRILGLFVLSALIPLAALAVVSWTAVTGELERQTQENLRQLARNAGQSMLQQMLLVEAGLTPVRIGEAGAAGRAESLRSTLPAVVSISVDEVDGRRRLSGTPTTAPALTQAHREVLDRGGNAVIPGEARGRIVLSVADRGPGSPGRRLWAEVVADSMWMPAQTFASLPWVSSFCVLMGPANQDYCSDGDDRIAESFREAPVAGDRLGTVDVQDGSDRWTVGFWSFHPASAFDAPPWTVLVAASAESVYAPLAGFSFWFVSIVALGFGVVLLLANIQVRRTMMPLDALEQGTCRISDGDFATRVAVDSEDEFGALARSFNLMAHRIGDQLARLEAGREIDRAVLGGFDPDEVVDAVIAQVPTLIPARSVAVLLCGSSPTDKARLHWRLGSEGLGGTDLTLSPTDRRWLEDHAHHGVADDGADFVRSARKGLGAGSLTVFPLLVKGHLRGGLIVETPPGVALDDDGVRNTRQLANQAAVAFDDARLVEELEEMSWGALRALARAIDAKSKWTSGHSERVTELALALGREMGLSSDDLELLHRGGLLHDVGKIGVPSRVLDSGKSLTEEDFAIIRRHPEIGGRILEPIRAFAPALPIVVQHHERWDGKGYPAGLVGEEIDPLARILAVANTYAVMASARPYRNALSDDVVIAEILHGAGTQFDPAATEAFARLMGTRGLVMNESREVNHG